MKNSILLIACVVCLFSCKKPEDRKCWKFNGETTTIEFPLEDFHLMKLNPHIAYEIVQDSLNKIEITGGKNLVKLIEFSVNNGLLEVSNKNKCSFLRNAKKELLVTIHLTTIDNIHYEGSEYLKSIGQIRSDFFALQIRDGAGPVTLDLKCLFIDADISHGWGDYTLTGETQSARLSARSNGYFDAFGLNVTDSLYVASDTPGTVKVHAEGIPLYGYAKNSGDIWYTGHPQTIGVVLTGDGELIDKN